MAKTTIGGSTIQHIDEDGNPVTITVTTLGEHVGVAEQQVVEVPEPEVAETEEVEGTEPPSEPAVEPVEPAATEPDADPVSPAPVPEG